MLIILKHCHCMEAKCCYIKQYFNRYIFMVCPSVSMHWITSIVGKKVDCVTKASSTVVPHWIEIQFVVGIFSFCVIFNHLSVCVWNWSCSNTTNCWHKIWQCCLILFACILSVGFYHAMLCIRGTSHGLVSVRPSVCLSVTSRSPTKTAKHRITQTHHMIAHGCQRSPRNSTGITGCKNGRQNSLW